MEHIYNQLNFGEDWFTYPNLYSDMVKKFPSGSKFVEVGSWKGKSSSYITVEIINSNKNIKSTVSFTGFSTHKQSIFNNNNGSSLVIATTTTTTTATTNNDLHSTNNMLYFILLSFISLFFLLIILILFYFFIQR